MTRMKTLTYSACDADDSALTFKCEVYGFKTSSPPQSLLLSSADITVDEESEECCS